MISLQEKQLLSSLPLLFQNLTNLALVRINAFNYWLLPYIINIMMASIYKDQYCIKHSAMLWLGLWVKQCNLNNARIFKRHWRAKRGGQLRIAAHGSIWVYCWCTPRVLRTQLGRLHHFSRNLHFFCTCHNFFPLSSVQIIIIPACCLLCVL